MSDVVMILAVLLGPLLAVQAQKWLERILEQTQRRSSLFRTLMTTRAERLSQPHVESLNMIDLDFSEDNEKDKAVRDSWRVYHDHLNSPDNDIERWARKSDDLFVDLLFSMSRSLKYGFDKVQLKRGIYSPRARGDEVQYQLEARKLLIEVLKGDRAIKITPFSQPVTDPAESGEVSESSDRRRRS